MGKNEFAPPVSVDATICRGCDMCMLACSLYHKGQCNPSLGRLRVTRDSDRYRFEVNICRQCEEPDCFPACPVDGAMERNAEGIVSIIEKNCIACGACAAACPYDSIAYHEDLGLYLKCNLCEGREAGPMCAEVCPTGALSYGKVKERVG
jgi:electron transport protein HydN